LHRPLLLDRRNAALVLLANSSWWILPWVAIQLLFTSLGRAILYLLAKLPGYAADEIAAIGLLIFKPSDLIKSRRYRKSSRVLTARVIKPFIPNRSIQIRTIFGRISSSLSGLFKSSKQEIAVASPSSYSDIGVIDESFDEIDFPAKQSFSKLRSLIKQPFLFGVLVTLIISVLYSRNRLGSLSGGAMAVAPASAIELITSYVNSWHLVGLGSSFSAPAWIPIIGIASFITAGNPQVFLAVLFFFAPTLLFIFSYRTARKYSLTNYSSVFVGFIYAFSPVTLTSINQGRLGTLVIALILPGLFTLLEKNRGLINIGWRKVFAIALIAGLAGAFSPLFLAAWIVFQIGVILYTYTKGANWKTKVISEIRENLSNEEFKKRLALMFMPVLINVPNSITLLLHPIKSLREPGLSLESAGPLSTILFNPGGPSAPAIYVLAPFLLYILIGIFSRDQKNSAISALLAISLAATISSFFIQGNNSQAQRIWSGPLVLFAQLLSLLLIFAIAERIIPQLRVSNFGFRHIASVFTALVTIVSMVTISIWVTSAGANSVLRANQEQVIPPFITDLASTDERPKTLVIRKSDDQLQYFVTRGGDLQIGNADVASQTPEQFHKAIVDLVNGVGGSTSQVLGFYGIKYVYMKNPADAGLTRTIDGIGGFTRSSATKDGIVWKVDKSHARVTFQNKQGQFLSVNSTDKSSKAYVSGAGLILLAEKYDKAWHLMLNGKPVPLQEHPFGIPIFEIQEQGEILLTHDGTNRRAWISLQLIALISTIVLALPAGRRRREVPLEELL